jgi:multicomponent Na+:H+ antiporter subunit A
MSVIEAVLILFMLVAAVATSVFRDLISAVVMCAAVSLLASVLFYLLDAPDVAMAEAAIGAGLTTAMFVVAVKKTQRYEE